MRRRFVRAWLAASLVLATIPASPAGAAPQAPLAAPDPAETAVLASVVPTDVSYDGYFGYALAVSGDTAIVGAPMADAAGCRDVGAAYVLTRSNAQWQITARLEPPDPTVQFGSSVAIDAGVAVVGAPESDKVFVFERNEAGWQPVAVLRSEQTKAGDSFGSSVAVHGDYVVVGAPRADDLAADAGAAYVFSRDGVGRWAEAGSLQTEGLAAGDWFGSAVAMTSDQIAVSARRAGLSALSLGMVRTYTLSGSLWTPSEPIPSPFGGAGFGASVSIDSSMAVVGSPVGKRADVFSRTPTGWVHECTLATADYEWGAGVSVGAGTIVVAGITAARIYRGAGATWTEAKKLVHPAGAKVPIGSSVALDGSGVMVGSMLSANMHPTEPSGAVYYLPNAYSTYEETTLTVSAPGILANDSATSGGGLQAVLDSPPAAGKVTIAPDGGFVYVPSRDRTGHDSFSYRVWDGFAYSLPATVAVFVNNLQDSPVARPDEFVTSEDTSLSIDPLGNDSEPDGELLAVTLTAGPKHGALSQTVSGGWVYSPEPEWHGTDSFAYRATDVAWRQSVVVSATVRVLPVNDVPSSRPDPALMGAAQLIRPAGLQGGDRFGERMAVDGGVFVVGTPWVAGDAGAVHVYDQIGSEWNERSKLTLPAAAGATKFGFAVDLAGDTLVVGAPDAEHLSTPHTGLVYVYTRSSTGWSLDATLAPPATYGGAHFGSALSVDRDRIIVGAPDASSGAVCVFERVADSWVNTHEITPDDPNASGFGEQLVASGDQLVVGAPETTVGSTVWAGAAFAYKFDGSVWQPDGSFPSTNPRYRGRFGSALALDGGRLAVAHTQWVYGGTVHMYSRDATGTWREDARLSSPSPPYHDGGFGSSVALEGERLMVGGYADGPGYTGVVREYSWQGSTWRYETTQASPAAAAGPDWFGSEVLLSEGRLLVGAPYAGGGAVYASRPSYQATAGVVLKVPAPGVLANDADVDGDTLAAQLLTAPSHGQVVLAPTGGFDYIADAGYQGADSFSYRTSDGRALSAPATVSIHVMSAAPSVSRIAGPDRFSTAAALARKGWDPTGAKGWPNVKHVIVVNGENGREPDALSAAGLAGVFDCPVLTVSTAKVPASTKTVIAEIAKKNPKVQVHIIGGPASVPDARWNEIKAIPGVNQTKDRIAGPDRYSTSAAIANRMITAAPAAGKTITGSILIAGDNPAAFYDALAVSPIAYAETMPLLSVKKGSIPPSVVSVLNSAALKGKTRYSASGVTYIGAPASGAIRLTTSADRYAAAAQIGNKAVAEGHTSPTHTGLAAKLPDALAGGTYLGKMGGVLLFTDSSAVIQSPAKSFITANKAKIVNGWVMGGTASVPSGQETSFRNLLK